MRDNDKETTLSRVKRRSSWQASQETGEGGKAVNQYTMFALGAATILAGFWAMACLANAFFQDGPLSMLRQLAAAITGH